MRLRPPFADPRLADPLSLSAGIGARLGLAVAVLAGLWAAVGWALAE